MYRLQSLVYPVPSRTPAQPPGGDESLSTQHFNQHSERSAIQNVLRLVAFTSAHNMHPQLILEVACWAQWGGGAHSCERSGEHV